MEIARDRCVCRPAALFGLAAGLFFAGGLTAATPAAAFTPQVDWIDAEFTLPDFNVARPDRAHELQARAYRALREDDWRTAMRISREWASVDPENDSPWVLQAWSMAEKNDYVGVVAAYNRAIDINPNQRMPVWRSLGVAYTVLGRNDYALTAYARATEIDPSEPRAWYDLCEAYLRAGQAVQAIAAAGQALVREPEHAEAWACRGSALVREQRLEEAIGAYRRAIDGKTLEPRTDRAAFWASLGWVYHQLDRADGVQEAVDGINRWNADAAARFREKVMAGRDAPPQ